MDGDYIDQIIKLMVQGESLPQGPHQIAAFDEAVRLADMHNDLTLGFRTRQKGVDTVVSVDAAVMLTDAGAIAVRLASVRAGALPLPVMPIADEVVHHGGVGEGRKYCVTWCRSTPCCGNRCEGPWRSVGRCIA